MLFSILLLKIAAIACLLNRIRKPNMVVGIDGSTYKYHPFFDFWVNEKLKELVDPSLKVIHLSLMLSKRSSKTLQ